MRYNPLNPNNTNPVAQPLKAPRKAKAPRHAPNPAAVFTTTLSENEAGTALHLRFPKAPPEDILKQLHDAKWHWHKYHFYWYHINTPENRVFAQRFLDSPAAERERSPFAAATIVPDVGRVPSPGFPEANPQSEIPNPQSNILTVDFAPSAAAPAPVPVTPAPVTATIPAWRARMMRLPAPQP